MLIFSECNRLYFSGVLNNAAVKLNVDETSNYGDRAYCFPRLAR